MEHPTHLPSPEVEHRQERQSTLRILHLEDNPHDQEFVRRELTRAGVLCDFVYADNETGFRRALERRNIDLILSDYTLPGYDGAEALVLAREICPDTPCLFVSGTIGEERAVESLKRGAADYVLKSNLARLPAAVLGAMREAGERRRRRQAEQALRESEARFREMARGIRDVFWIAPPDAGELLYVSPAVERIWGRPVSAFHEQPALWIESIHPDDRARVLASLAAVPESEGECIEYRITRPDGAERWIETRAYPSRDSSDQDPHVVGVATDVTDRRHLQEQLLQAQKMEALGMLAGGVAHDFNNLLTVINGYAGMALARDDLPPSIVPGLQRIYTAGERAADLTRRLLVFSRKETMRLLPVDLNACIRETVALLARLIGENIAIDLDLASDPPRARADAGMIEQLLMNLAVNARDAMPEGGRLSIRTATREFDAREAAALPSRRAGRFAHLAVGDTGTGIPPDVLPRIFEPFFTTKKSGQGTGLGLAMVFGIAEKHRGWIEVENRVNAGASFHLFLPALDTPATEDADLAIPPVAVDGGETILLVEDDPAVREFARSVLQRHGYRVLQAASGRDALETWKWHSARIRLLLTDMVLPDGIGGLDLAKKLRADAPRLQVVCASGYTFDSSETLSSEDKTIRFLSKPYQPRELARTVRECLDSTTGHRP